MRAALQERISPTEVPKAKIFNQEAVNDQTKLIDKLPKVDFKSVLQSSNEDIQKKHAATKKGGDLSQFNTYEEFLDIHVIPLSFKSATNVYWQDCPKTMQQKRITSHPFYDYFSLLFSPFHCFCKRTERDRQLINVVPLFDRHLIQSFESHF